MPEAKKKFMQPIATDTILQQRYRLMRLIGEGGFGRTYLATDQSRFGEPCAIKELAVASHSRSRLSKAREFFKQEAALLYQLQHPQIPRFWATFEERDRMFLVQDFIPGRTYDSLLQERVDRKQTFTEAEVWRFLLQVLPVLGYIHSQGVVHQDISPDNIILRETDLLPVLIDFGVVKQLANRLQGEQTGLAAVNVGKPGYAPVEQLSSGYAYPNSDLYALGVTAVVLLTGRTAPELFTDQQINWAWRNWVNVSDGLADVLGKMLSQQPGDRYQSAVEVFQALQSLSIPLDRVDQTKPLAVTQLRSGTADSSANRATTAARRVYNAVTQFDVKSVWERPLVFIPLFLVVAGLSFAGGLTAMSFFTRPSTVASPSPSTSPSNQPLVDSTTTGAAKTTKAIDLIAGQTTLQSHRLDANQEDIYEFYGTQGQDITLAVDNKSLLLTVLGPNGSPVDAQAIRTPSWHGRILGTGKHTVQVKPLPGAKDQFFDYRLSTTLALIAATPKPVDSGVPSPSAVVTSPNPVNELPAIAPSGSTPRPVPITIPSSQPRSVTQPSSAENSEDLPQSSPVPTPSFMEQSPQTSPSSNSPFPTVSVSSSSSSTSPTPAETLSPP
jgi:serine/threonine protein kinase